MKTHLLATLLGLGLTACSSSAPAPASPDAPPADGEDTAAPPADGRPEAPAADATAATKDSGSVTADGATADAGPSDAGLPDATSGGWPPVADYAARGPYPITREKNTGPQGAYDVFRPAALGPRKHPIISWANGTLFALDDYQKLLEHWASHGFVVIAGHTNNTAGGGTHKAGIDWLIAEDGRAGSAYLGVLDPGKIGAAGHSQGGGATIAAGSNKPGATGIVATLPLMPILSFESDKTIVTRQTAPMLNINATMDNRDPTGAIANRIFDGAAMELVQASFIGIHEDAMNVAMHRPTLAWFRWRLMDDQAAKALFYPMNTCGLCQDAAWKQVRYKHSP
jgi:hypothetical protein